MDILVAPLRPKYTLPAEVMPGVPWPPRAAKGLTMTAYEIVNGWAEQNHVRFVSRTPGQYTTDTVSKASLEELVSAATAPLLKRIAEQLRTIEALNSAINGHGSTTTKNLMIVGRLEARIAELEAKLAQQAEAQEPCA